MTCGALDAEIAGSCQRPPFLDTASRDVGDETSARVPTDKVFNVFRDFDDALADGLVLAAVHRGQEQVPDMCLRDGVGFYDRDVRSRLD